MISRLTAFAALFAVVTTATLAFAANSASDQAAIQMTAKAMPIYQLERVVITGKRVSKLSN
jgi:hypothetical protein